MNRLWQILTKEYDAKHENVVLYPIALCFSVFIVWRCGLFELAFKI